MKKCFSIGEFTSFRELRNIAEKIKVRLAKSGEYGGCAALFIALRSIKSNVTFVVWGRALSACMISFRFVLPI
jgi:hypothetical protein